MATKIVKTLEFPNSSDSYQINAAYLNGETKEDILSQVKTYELSSSPDSANGNVEILLNSSDTGASVNSVRVQGTGATTVTTDANGVVTINSPATPANAGSADKVNHALTVGSKNYDGSAPVTIYPSDLGLGQAMRFLGSASTEITDGSTLSTIIVNSEVVDVVNGDVVLYGGYEYVWTGVQWEQLGQEGSFSLKGHTHTTDELTSGTQIWHFNCGTATTVVD